MEGKMSVNGVNPPEYRVQRDRVHYRMHILFAFHIQPFTRHSLFQ